jgi:hypothetical protein
MNGEKWLATHRAAVEQVIRYRDGQPRRAHRLIREVPLPEDSRYVAEDTFDNGPPAIVPDAQEQLEIQRAVTRPRHRRPRLIVKTAQAHGPRSHR